MITCNATENGRTYGSAELTVEISNSERFFTVYNMAGKPMATITRPLTYDRTSHWEVHDTQGVAIAKRVFGARSAFLKTVVHFKGKM